MSEEKISKLPKEFFEKERPTLEEAYEKLQYENEELLQKLVYSLSPTSHSLGNKYNEKFKQIIRDNLDLETCKIKRLLKDCWEDKYDKEIKNIAEYEVNDSELAKYTILKLHEENKQLKRMLNIKEKLDKKEIPYEWDFKDMFDMREENTQLKQQLKDKDEKISKVVDYIVHQDFMDWHTGVEEGLYRRKDSLNILNILDNQ